MEDDDSEEEQAAPKRVLRFEGSPMKSKNGMARFCVDDKVFWNDAPFSEESTLCL